MAAQEQNMAKIIAQRMKNAANAKTYADLGKILGGISSQSISGAIAKGKIPDRWFEVMESAFGVTRDSLCKPSQAVVGSSEQFYDILPGSKKENPKAEMLSMVEKVLESETQYRSALAVNIKSYYRAVIEEKEMGELRVEMEKLRSQMTAMVNEVSELKTLLLEMSGQQDPQKKFAGNNH